MIISEWKQHFLEVVKLPIIEWIKNGIIREIIYVNDIDDYHRLPDLGPARIMYYNNGIVQLQEYCIESKSHRLDGPAVIKYSKNKDKLFEHFYINNNKH